MRIGATWMTISPGDGPGSQTTDRNKGRKKRQKIIDSTASMANRSLKSGMSSGVTPPSRKWYRLGPSDPSLKDNKAVDLWADDFTTRMHNVMLRSNLYQCLPTLYGDMGVFATGCMIVEEDFETVFRCHVQPVGSYCISTDHKGRVRGFFREFEMTVRQMVEKFGRLRPQGQGHQLAGIFSDYVKNEWEQGPAGYEAGCLPLHPVEPGLRPGQVGGQVQAVRFQLHGGRILHRTPRQPPGRDRREPAVAS